MRINVKQRFLFLLTFLGLLTLLPTLAGAQALLIHSTDWTTGTVGSTTAGAAGTTTGAGDGWIDNAGSVATAGSAGKLVITTGGSPWANNQVVLRPASDGSVRDERLVATFSSPGALNGSHIGILRWTATNTMYFVSLYYGAGANVTLYRDGGGTITQIGAAQTFSVPAAGHAMSLTFDASGASPTTLTVTLRDTTAATTLVNGYSTTDSSGPQVAGQMGLSATGTGPAFLTAQTYNLNPAATGFTITPPSGSGGPGVASAAFTVAPNGVLSADETLTLTDGGAGGTFTPASLSFTSGQTASNGQTFTYTPAGGATGALTLTATPSPSLGTPPAATYGIWSTVAPNAAGILYSPYNWLVSGAAAKTVNSGAYLRTLLTGTTACKLNLTVGTATPYTQLWARLSGGAWQQYTPTTSGAQTWTLTMPTGSTAAKYLLEVVVKSSTETQDRWTAQATAVQITGLTLDSGGAVTLPASRRYRALIFGDSITEGVRVNGFSGIANDTDRNDALLDYSLRLGELLDAEIGVVGFGATGLTVSGSGNVPALSTSYALLWSGQARSFSPVPDLVIYNEGTNESSATLSAMTTALQTVVNGIGFAGSGNTNAGLNGTRHLVLRPFGGAQAANLSAIAAGFGSGNVVYGDTTGFWSSAESSDSTHPYGYAHLGQIAPQVAALALPLLRPASGGTKRRLQ